MGPHSRRIDLPSASRKRKPAARPAAKVRRPAAPSHAAAKSKPKGKPAPSNAPKPVPKSAGKSAAPPASKNPEALAVAAPRPGDSRRHVMSLSFLRDGDEFLARMETDTGQITELKNRSLDQLLTLVASELEDLLE